MLGDADSLPSRANASSAGSFNATFVSVRLIAPQTHRLMFQDCSSGISDGRIVMS